ncbi:MAG TPA: 1-deoxy-D-xylulose-5-phosphate reductoisomerase [Ignavibacteria bacterium]|nr:1-deoxy-D-xylulose-5-phosphate reductoisomerase [Ignavibacteria bacterium]
MKKVCLLGSTGSIGSNTLEIIKNLNKNEYPVKVVCLSTNKRIDLLSEQIKEFNPETVVITDKKSFVEFNLNYNFPELEVLFGEEGLTEVSCRDNYELLITALVGFSGLNPTVNAIKSGKDIALANKETLVIAGKLINDLIEKHKVKLIPIDSEHSAILQCLAGEDKKSVKKIILTASGGPFRNKTYDELKTISVNEALIHPNWKMGAKITIDSATMMNKGLEVIEAKWLFEIDNDSIEVLIHPQSVIHSMVEFIDGSVKAQLGIPDMKIPIQYAVTFPKRIKSDLCNMDFKKFSTLTFETPDFNKFRCLKIAYNVLNHGGTYPVVMNAANEIAVELFLKEKISFLSIPDIIEKQLEIHDSQSEFNLEEISKIDKETRCNIISRYNSL